MVTAYQQLYTNKSLDNDKEELLMWFITWVMLIIHIASWAKNNWHPFAFIKGSPPLYSSIVTSSDEAFALFLLKHYRSPPAAKECKTKVRGLKYITSAKWKKENQKHYKQKTHKKYNVKCNGKGNHDRGKDNNDDNKKKGQKQEQ